MKQLFCLMAAVAYFAAPSIAVAEVYRDYTQPVTDSEKKDIVYIITSMANKPLTKLFKMKSSLESAGDRINHVHPLRFLECVFTDEELKVGIRNIKGRGWVWSDFYGGLKDSLHEESLKDNMRDEFIADFCLNINIGIDIVNDAIQQRRWSDFLTLLIKHIPREGDHDRYDF